MDVRMIPMSQLDKCPIQFRPVRKETLEYLQLKDSIREYGILQSLCCRPYNNRYQVCMGFNRHSIAEDLRLIEVPCIIRNMDDAEIQRLQIAENLQRIPVFNTDIARRLWRIVNIDQTLTLPQLSAQLHLTVNATRERLSLIQLCPEAELQLNDNKLSLKLAIELAKLPHEHQKRLLSIIITLPDREQLELIRGEARHYRQSLKNDRLARKLHTISNVEPIFRKREELLHELIEPTMMASVIEACGARTPTEIWKACLQFVFSIDPLTHKRRKLNMRTEI